MRASLLNQLQIIQLLLKYQADVNARTEVLIICNCCSVSEYKVHIVHALTSTVGSGYVMLVVCK